MAKDSSARIQTISDAVLVEVDKELEAAQGKVAALRDLLKQNKMKSLDVDGGGKWRRATKLVDDFAFAVEIAVAKKARK